MDTCSCFTDCEYWNIFEADQKRCLTTPMTTQNLQRVLIHQIIQLCNLSETALWNLENSAFTTNIGERHERFRLVDTGSK